MNELDARQRALAENNLRLVYFVLKKIGVYKSRYDYDDLFGAGCIGLCNAARVFREGGSAFSTFAFHVIKHEVLRVLISHERDKTKLMPLNEFYECAVAPDCGFEKIEADMLIKDFCRCANQNLGDVAAEVVYLLTQGKNCRQIATTLGISISAVDKAKKRAKTAMVAWLKDGK